MPIPAARAEMRQSIAFAPFAAVLALSLAPRPATAQVTPPARAASAANQTLPEVEIRAQRASPVEERRSSTASKIVVGRDEIEQYGDSTLGDVMRRLPGVTLGGRPGRGGEIRMRGMGSGYTQILLDGQRPPPGFQLDQLSPDLVERIEILRAPTAETGTRAVAGTINIILREPLRTRTDDLRLSLPVERGRASPDVSWTRNDAFAEKGTYNLTVNARHASDRTDTTIRTTYRDAGAGTPLVDREWNGSDFTQRDRASAMGRLQWRFGPGEQFSLAPFVMRSIAQGEGQGTLSGLGGVLPPPYSARLSTTPSDFSIGRLNAQLARRLAPDTRIELTGSIGRFALDSFGEQDQFATDGSPVLTQTTLTSIRDRSAALTGKWMQTLVDTHSLVGGAEFERVRRDEDNLTVIAPAASPARNVVGDVQAGTRRIALYLQDEWDPAKDWSAYLGLRAEQIDTHSDSVGAPVDNTSRVVSPLAHVVWRFDAPRRDQLRLSLTHSYRPPQLGTLTAVPSLNTSDPVPGANNPTTADRIGNPALRPEIAHGIDLALERYLAQGGVIAVNLFHRRIRDLIRTTTTLEDVPWADVQRWVARPRNFGHAQTSGIEFDAKGRLDEFVAGWPAIRVHANVSVFRSRVEDVPAPDNRIDQQPSATGNFGLDSRIPGTPWTLGGTLNFTPDYRTQITDVQAQETGLKRIVDAYALWQIDPRTRLRISLSNLVPANSTSTSSIVVGPQLQTVHTSGRSDTVVALRMELRL